MYKKPKPFNLHIRNPSLTYFSPESCTYAQSWTLFDFLFNFPCRAWTLLNTNVNNPATWSRYSKPTESLQGSILHSFNNDTFLVQSQLQFQAVVLYGRSMLYISCLHSTADNVTVACKNASLNQHTLLLSIQQPCIIKRGHNYFSQSVFSLAKFHSRRSQVNWGSVLLSSLDKVRDLGHWTIAHEHQTLYSSSFSSFIHVNLYSLLTYLYFVQLAHRTPLSFRLKLGHSLYQINPNFRIGKCSELMKRVTGDFYFIISLFLLSTKY